MLANQKECLRMLLHHHYDPAGVAVPPPCDKCDRCCADASRWVSVEVSRKGAAAILAALDSAMDKETLTPTFDTMKDYLVPVFKADAGKDGLASTHVPWFLDAAVASNVLIPKFTCAWTVSSGQEKAYSLHHKIAVGNQFQVLRKKNCRLGYRLNRHRIYSGAPAEVRSLKKRVATALHAMQKNAEVLLRHRRPKVATANE